MSQEDVETVVAIVRDVFNRDPSLDETWRDMPRFLVPEFEYREDPSWPGAGTYRGIEAFRKVTSGYMEAFGKMTLEVEEAFDAGDRVVAFIRLVLGSRSGRHGGRHAPSGHLCGERRQARLLAGRL